MTRRARMATVPVKDCSANSSPAKSVIPSCYRRSLELCRQTRTGWKQRVKPLARAALRLFPGLRGLARKQAADQFASGQFTVEILKSSFEMSLRELKTDHVDILLMHAAPISALHQDTLMDELGRLVEAGKVRLAGISGEEDVIGAVFANRPPQLRTAQFPLNILNLAFTAQTARAAESMFLVANHPFGGPEGISRCREKVLVARHGGAAGFPAQKLDPADESLLPELVLNSILSETGISVVIPSMMQLKHLQSNIKAVEHCRFSPEELAIIRSALQSAASDSPRRQYSVR